MTKYVILIPCFNDWDSLNFLIPQIDKAIQDINESIDIFIVNDSSTKENNLEIKNINKIKNIRILNLKKNVKAQIAIASGLKYLNQESFDGGVIVMDADGQDDPSHLLNIIKESKKDLKKAIVVMRLKRDDSFIFNVFYRIYLLLTLIFTFKYMKFGVFSYISSKSIEKLFSNNDIYKAYAGTLAKNFKDKKIIWAPRRKRIVGESKNNYKSLIHYSLKIISIFRKQVLINSVVIMIVLLLASSINFFTVYCVIFIIILLLFNFLIFSINRNVEKSIEIIDLLKNVKNLEVLKN